MHYDVIIVGAGPAGLACAAKLSANKLSTLIVERSNVIGRKVCAGGITYSGLLKTVPESLIEKSFSQQHVSSRLQNIVVSEKFPIIATVNRRKLGLFMAETAISNGAQILTSSVVRAIEENKLHILDRKKNETFTARFSYLIGADGSSSIVRRYLGLPFDKVGFGINYQIPGTTENMEWHLHSRYFKNGYSWIFPHRQTISIGAYIAGKNNSAAELKNNLCLWAASRGINLTHHKCQAGVINYDHQGWQFNNIFLVGDAGGFASALTGEGIYPAILSGEAAAEKILHPNTKFPHLDKLLRKHRTFTRFVDLSSINAFTSATMAEIGVALLRGKLVKFTALEMGH